MAGHSKWANIQFRKNSQDAKRGQLFTKLIREITVASRSGADPAANSRLRLAMDKALNANVSKDTIERAIQRGSGGLDRDDYQEVRYEGYAPGGIAVMVDCMTDNRNRTVSEVRHCFTKCGGSLATDGAVAYLFRLMGVMYYAPDVPEEALLEAALEAGADDMVVAGDGSREVLVQPDHLEVTRQVLEKAGFPPAEVELGPHPLTKVAVDEEHAATVERLLADLDQLDDVQAVYSNAEFGLSVTG